MGRLRAYESGRRVSPLSDAGKEFLKAQYAPGSVLNRIGCIPSRLHALSIFLDLKRVLWKELDSFADRRDFIRQVFAEHFTTEHDAWILLRDHLDRVAPAFGAYAYNLERELGAFV